MAEALMAMDPVAITNDFKKNMEEGQSLSELNRMRDLIKEYRPELEDEVAKIMADYAPPPPPQIEEIEVTATRRQMDEILETMLLAKAETKTRSNSRCEEKSTVELTNPVGRGEPLS